MKVQANNPCCVCNSTKSEFLFEISYPKFSYPGVFALRRCTGCNLIFNSPRLTDDEFPALYDGNYYFFNRKHRHEFGRIVPMVARTVSQVDGPIAPKRVLEIGSARGYLLAVLKQLGWEVKGVEISAAAGGYARDTFGLDVFTGTLEEYVKNPSKETFPLVLAIDVLEHVLDPADFINCVNEVIQEKGVLVIDTPNGAAHNISIEKSTWGGFNPFHIFLFNKENLTRLLEEKGYVVETVFSYGNSISGRLKNDTTPLR